MFRIPSVAVRYRLIAVAAVALLPAALLAWPQVAGVGGDIARAERQIAGAAYIAALAPEVIGLAKLEAAGGAIAASTALEARMAAADAALNTASVSRAYRDLRAQAASGQHPAAARMAGVRLVSAIADGAGLARDADAATHRLMEAVGSRVPAAVVFAPALLADLKAAKFALAGREQAQVALAASLGVFRASVSPGELTPVAARSGGTGALGGLMRLEQAFVAAGERYVATVATAAAALGNDTARAAIDLGRVSATHQGFQDAALAYWQGAATELDKRLAARADGLRANLQAGLAIVAALVGAAALVAWLIGRTITGRLRALAVDLAGVADGSRSDVRHAEGQDEIATVARAALDARERATERAAAAERDNAAAQRAEEARVLAEAERQRLEESKHDVDAERSAAVATLGAALQQLAQGHLAAPLEGPFPSEMDELRLAFNAGMQRMADVIGSLRHSSRALRIATGELLAGTNDLSERTQRQAATIDEVSTTIDQLAATVNANADSAKSASSNAADVTKAANAGGIVMQQANAAMERITASSGKISQIVGLIDDIAFQTNLLALNASVEAARAGEAGKGFAVVAIEVRRLAQSAAEASHEIKALIEQSVGEVEGGSRLVAEAVARLTAILEAAESNTATMQSIAGASQAQAASIGEVNTAVRQLHEMTQHNAALVEQTNAAIEQSQAQASALEEIVDAFTVAKAVAEQRARAA